MDNSDPFSADQNPSGAATSQGHGSAVAAVAASLDGSHSSARYTGQSQSRTSNRPISDRVPLTAVLARYGLLASLRRRGNRLVGKCPIHGGRNDRQFVVNETASTWFCFGDCNHGGGTIAFAAAMERESAAAAAARIAVWFALSPTTTPSPQRRSPMGARPTHKVLAVSDRPDGKNGTKAYFTKIGVAWPIKGGAGLSIQLEALPINPRLVLMEFDDQDEAPEIDDTHPASSPKSKE
jgi:hypothetical protein